MVQLRMSTDSSPNSTRMETICDQKANLVDGALKVISKDERPKSSLDESNQESNLKLKRCKHGRIIVKDLSKKKPVQQGDKDEDPSKNYSSNNNNSRTKNNNLTEETAQTSQSTEIDLTAQTSGAKTPEETTSKTTPATDCNAIKSEIKSPIGVKLSGRCDDGLRVADPQMRRRPSKSPSRHVRSSKVEGRSRTPLRRRQLSRSPSPKTPPPRTSRASPHRRKRSYSRSPRSRRDRSRSRSRSRSPRSSRRSPRRNHRRSPRRSKNSSNNRQSSRHSPRHRSPRRNRSRSRTRTRSKSPYRLSKLSNRETSKSPEGFRRDKTSRESGRERGLSRVFDKSPKELCERQNKDMTVVGKVLPFQQTLDAPAITSAAVAQDGLKSNSINHTNLHAIADNIHETAHPTASPHRSNTSMTISSNDSVSSDIYDPEGPILPISPGDSPPLSPINRAANDTISNNKFLHIEKDDDEMPSSAVELNSQEKYLQKLNRQERVVEEVKIALKPHYQKRAISKDQYKDVLRRAVPKICHSKNGEINPVKIRSLVDAYVKKMKK